MGFTLWNLFKAGLLVTDGVAVLHRKRFLRKYGLDEVRPGEPAGSIRGQVIGLLNAIQYLKLPLVVLNIMTIVVELVFGG